MRGEHSSCNPFFCNHTSIVKESTDWNGCSRTKPIDPTAAPIHMASTRLEVASGTSTIGSSGAGDGGASAGALASTTGDATPAIGEGRRQARLLLRQPLALRQGRGVRRLTTRRRQTSTLAADAISVLLRPSPLARGRGLKHQLIAAANEAGDRPLARGARIETGYRSGRTGCRASPLARGRGLKRGYKMAWSDTLIAGARIETVLVREL
jgi:hypothetical protein